MAVTEISKNKAQDQCIENHEGKWLVIAGPGTGKTRTISERIKNMINKDIHPEEILCLTFSDTAAKEMKNRVGEDYPINVFTFHSFCLNIMEEHSEEFDLEDFQIITDSHKRTLITECISELKPKAYRDEKGNSYKYIQTILDGIDEIKKNRINKKDYMDALENNPMWKPNVEFWKQRLEDFRNGIKNGLRKEPIKAVNIAQAKVDKAEELWDLYEAYELKKTEAKFIDFNDMIDMVLKKFSDKQSYLLEEVAEKYKYIIVDEYQDTNLAQNEIVFKLGEYCPNIFVVGDDDQIIFTFQGAHLDTMLNYIRNFKTDEAIKDITIKCFDKNYRSTNEILRVADELAQLQDNGFNKFMQTKSGLSAAQKTKYLTTPTSVNRLLSLHPIVDENGNNIKKELIPADDSAWKDVHEPVEFIPYADSDSERNDIVNKIIELKKEFEEYNKKEKERAEKADEEPKYKKLSDIAILTRYNSDLSEYEDYLKANGIPVEITGGKNIFKINAVNALITYMQFLTNPEQYSNKMLTYLLLKPFNIDSRDFKILSKKVKNNRSLADIVEKLVSKGLTEKELKEKLQNCIDNSYENTVTYEVERLLKNEEIIIHGREKLKKFLETYNYLKEHITGENYRNSLLVIGEKTGIFDYYFCKDATNKLENVKGVKKLIEVADAYSEVYKDSSNNIVGFVNYLNKLIENDMEIKLDKEDVPLNAVQLSTYHSSKGREFEYVFMPMLNKGRWESSSGSYNDSIPLPENVCTNSMEHKEKIEALEENVTLIKYLDNLKLLYVGMTRAKHKLYLSYGKSDSPTGQLSWFIEQILENENIHQNEEKEVEFAYSNPEYLYDYKSEFCEYLPENFSPSAINTYRNCPKQYLYQYILGLSSNDGNNDNSSFGTSMHKAFEHAIITLMNDKKYPDYNEVYQVFCDTLDKLEPDDPEGLKTSAKEKIFCKDGYYDKFKLLVNPDKIDKDAKFNKHPKLNSQKDGKHSVYAECPFHCEIDPKDLDMDLEPDKTLTFNGIIDRLDKTPDGKFEIYDYKSSDNCDNISPSNNYFFQMAIYKYAIEHQVKDANVTKACFLLPLEKNGKKEHDLSEKFESIKKGEENTNYENTKKKIFECIKGIYNSEFDVPKTKNCTFCGYKSFCTTKTV